MESELSMVKFGSSFVSFVSFFGRFIISQELHLTTELDFGIPLQVPFIQVRPSEAGFARFSLGINAILSARAVSQICNPVVFTNTVFMVNLVGVDAIDV